MFYVAPYVVPPAVVVLLIWVLFDWWKNKGTLKDCLKRVLKNWWELFKKETEPEPPPRYEFTSDLTADFGDVVDAYALKSFKTEVMQLTPEAMGMTGIAPQVAVKFVPNHSLDDAEVARIKQLLAAKFDNYFWVYHSAQSFTHIVVRDTSLAPFEVFRLYYMEREADRQPFVELYQREIRKVTKLCIRQPLTDERLDRELRQVDR